VAATLLQKKARNRNIQNGRLVQNKQTAHLKSRNKMASVAISKANCCGAKIWSFTLTRATPTKKVNIGGVGLINEPKPTRKF
jgi:hypothetical protein